jgi:predicted nucleotidyltransferase
VDSREIAEKHTILRGLVGSTVHGTAIDGREDIDEMGVCIEPPECVVGLSHFDHWQFRTQPDGVRSGPGDLDLTVYSLRRWAGLALRGNPSILLLLFVPDDRCSVLTPEGRLIREHSDLFVSREAGRRFFGFMKSQLDRLTGVRGQKRVKRPELVERLGFDSKYAGHVIRLALQGTELMTTGKLSLPMAESDRKLVVDVRTGKCPLPEIVQMASDLGTILKGAIEHADLPENADRGLVNDLLIQIYDAYWLNHDAMGYRTAWSEYAVAPA